MDPELGTFRTADVLLQGDRILAIAERLDPGDALVVDLTGSVLHPGFVDTGRRTWMSTPDSSVLDIGGPLLTNLPTRAEIAGAMAPDDLYVHTRSAALDALRCGITTLVDIADGPIGTDHLHAGIDALLVSGIRAVVVPVPVHAGAETRGSTRPWESQVRDLRDREFPDDHRLVTMRLGALSTALAGELRLPHLAYGAELDSVAIDLDLGVDILGIAGPHGRRDLARWAVDGLLGPQVDLVDPVALDAVSWEEIRDFEVGVSIGASTDNCFDTADIDRAVRRALDHHVTPGLAGGALERSRIDVFTTLRQLIAGTPDGPGLPASVVLDLATRASARAVCLEDRIGSLRPGARADLVILDRASLLADPTQDPVDALVRGATVEAITSVWVAGHPRVWDGELVGVDTATLSSQARDSSVAVAHRIRESRLHGHR